jgi:hypothetical protein
LGIRPLLLEPVVVVTLTVVVVVTTVVGGVVTATVVVGLNDVVVSGVEDSELPHPTSATSESAPTINRIRICFSCRPPCGRPIIAGSKVNAELSSADTYHHLWAHSTPFRALPL